VRQQGKGKGQVLEARLKKASQEVTSSGGENAKQTHSRRKAIAKPQLEEKEAGLPLLERRESMAPNRNRTCQDLSWKRKETNAGALRRRKEDKRKAISRKRKPPSFLSQGECYEKK